MNTESAVKQQIKELCRHLKITPTELARQIGVDQPNISQLGTPKRPGISKELIIKIAKRYTEVNPWWLMTGEGEMLIPMKPEKNLEIVEESGAAYGDPFAALRALLKSLDDRIAALEESLAHKDELLRDLMSKMGQLLQDGGGGEDET